MLDLKWPLKEGRVTSKYGFRLYPKKGLHSGIDIAAEVNTPGKPAYKGDIVVIAKWPSYGNLVIVHHHTLGNVWTLYAHLTGVIPGLCVGDHIDAEHNLFLTGNTGCSTGPHLHFEVRVGRNRIVYAKNPERYLPKLIKKEASLWIPRLSQ